MIIFSKCSGNILFYFLKVKKNLKTFSRVFYLILVRLNTKSQLQMSDFTPSKINGVKSDTSLFFVKKTNLMLSFLYCYCYICFIATVLCLYTGKLHLAHLKLDLGWKSKTKIEKAFSLFCVVSAQALFLVKKFWPKPLTKVWNFFL